MKGQGAECRTSEGKSKAQSLVVQHRVHVCKRHGCLDPGHSLTEGGLARSLTVRGNSPAPSREGHSSEL